MSSFQTHLQSVEQRAKRIEQLNRQAAEKAEKSAALERRLPELRVAAAERTHACEALGNTTRRWAAKGDFNLVF